MILPAMGRIRSSFHSMQERPQSMAKTRKVNLDRPILPPPLETPTKTVEPKPPRPCLAPISKSTNPRRDVGSKQDTLLSCPRPSRWNRAVTPREGSVGRLSWLSERRRRTSLGRYRESGGVGRPSGAICTAQQIKVYV